jgi:hypothetical protein
MPMTWPSTLTLRSIQTWPSTRTPDENRRSSPFRAALTDTLDLLSRELAALRATDIAMEIALTGDPGSNPIDWRQDGRPRANARPAHPGVVLAFRTPLVPGRELRYATDRFWSWQDNLRAIALGLEALRKVERYGIANRGEQYAGWAQLTAGGPNPDRGRDLIREHGSVRQALMATHPDQGGDSSDFADVQAARDAEAAA